MTKHKLLKLLSAGACLSMMGGILVGHMPTVLGGIAIGVATLLYSFEEPKQ